MCRSFLHIVFVNLLCCFPAESQRHNSLLLVVANCVDRSLLLKVPQVLVVCLVKHFWHVIHKFCVSILNNVTNCILFLTYIQIKRLYPSLFVQVWHELFGVKIVLFFYKVWYHNYPLGCAHFLFLDCRSIKNLFEGDWKGYRDVNCGLCLFSREKFQLHILTVRGYVLILIEILNFISSSIFCLSFLGHFWWISSPLVLGRSNLEKMVSNVFHLTFDLAQLFTYG